MLTSGLPTCSSMVFVCNRGDERMASLATGVLRPNGSLSTIEYTVCLAEGSRASIVLYSCPSQYLFLARKSNQMESA